MELLLWSCDSTPNFCKVSCIMETQYQLLTSAHAPPPLVLAAAFTLYHYWTFCMGNALHMEQNGKVSNA